jgi:uncharacterized membrane protein YfcA
MEPFLQYGILFLTGILSGTSSGLFGIGGGVLMTPVQFWLYTGGGIDSTLATRIAFGTSLAVMIPTMASGALAHHKHGAVNWGAAVQLGIAAVFGGMAGGTLAAHLPGLVLRAIFAVLIIVMAIRMFWHIHTCPVCEPGGSLGIYLLIGFFIGVVSGLAGIGGGVLLVPVLVILLGYPMHTAVGTSSACLIFSSAGAVGAYIFHGLGVVGLPPYTIGYVDFLTFVILAVTTIPAARLGARIAHTYSGRTLQIIFAGAMVIIGILMLASG